MKRDEFYSVKKVIKNFFWLAALIVACKLTGGVAIVIMIPLVVGFAMAQKNTALVYSILIVAVMMTINPFFVPKGIVFMVGQKVIMLITASILFAQIFGFRHSKIVTPLLAIMPYMIFITISSQVGWAPTISNLKLVLFSMVFFAYYGVSVRVMQDGGRINGIREIILAVAIFIIIGSVLVIPFPGISMMGIDEITFERRSEFVSLFKGVCSHSQALGPTVSMLGVMLFADWVFSIQKKDWLYFGLLLCCPVLIYKTSSRTAMGSFLAGMMVVSYFAISSKMVGRRLRSKIFVSVLMVVIIGGLSVLSVPSMRDKVLQYITKNYKGDITLEKENILGSRQGKLDGAIENWKRSPWIGNGFQVSEDMVYTKISGIKDMLSAPVEKSTWMYAILEEGGIIGMVLFCIFILVSITLMVKRKAYIGASLLFTMIIVNMGEFGIFATSLIGGMYWCMVFMGVIIDHKRLQEIRQNQQMAMIR